MFCVSSHWKALTVVKSPNKELYSIIICTISVKYDKHFQSKFVNYLKKWFCCLCLPTDGTVCNAFRLLTVFSVKVRKNNPSILAL